MTNHLAFVGSPVASACSADGQNYTVTGCNEAEICTTPTVSSCPAAAGRTDTRPAFCNTSELTTQQTCEASYWSTFSGEQLKLCIWDGSVCNAGPTIDCGLDSRGLDSYDFSSVVETSLTRNSLNVSGIACASGFHLAATIGLGWHMDSGGQSCDDVCAVAGASLTCSTDRPGVVNSEASFIAINQCLVARGEAGFSCGSYSEQGHHLMPGQYGDGGQCNYVPNGTTYVRCDGSHPNDHRLCCCIGIGENPSTACPQTPIDCSAPTAVIVTACTSAGQNYAVTGCVADTCTRPSGAAGYDFSAVVETNLEADSFNVTVSVFVFARVRARWPPVLGLASAFVFLIFLVFSWSFLGLRFHSSSLKKTSPASRASPVRPGSPVRQRYQPAQRTGRATRSPAAHRPFTVRSACGSRLGLPSTRAAA